MYLDSQNNGTLSKLDTNSNPEEIEVTVRNLPNDATESEILSYLEIAGPIKSRKFNKEQERYSVVITYYDNESVEQCKKNLADKYFKGRALTITAEAKKNYQNNNNNNNNSQYAGNPGLSVEQDMHKQIHNLKRQQRKLLLGLLKNQKSDGKIFEMFLQSRPKLVQALLNKSLMQ